MTEIPVYLGEAIPRVGLFSTPMSDVSAPHALRVSNKLLEMPAASGIPSGLDIAQFNS